MIQIDMRLPEKCEQCPLCHRAFDGNETRLACFGLGAYCYEDDGRLDNCPLHEVIADEDTISRKQAIDAIQKTSGMLMYQIDGFNRLDAEDIIKNLPPSPSRPQIHCKDCKYYIKPESYCDHLGITISDNDYCSMAKEGGAV